MRSENYSMVKEFIFIGFSGIQKFKIPLFLIIAVIYILILSGNVLIIFFVWKDYRLHTPMYWLLGNLSFSGLCFTTVIIPQMKFNIITERKVISFMGCIMQMYFYFFLGTSDYILLAIMAFDRYVAICKPLRYSVIMSGWFTFQLAAGSWTGAFFSVLFSTIPFYLIPFCDPNVINHFYCDILPVLRLACKDTTMLKWLSYISTALIVLCSLFLTSVSYIYIIATILRIPSSSGRQKAFSTCVAHITLALIFLWVFHFHVPSTRENPFLWFLQRYGPASHCGDTFAESIHIYPSERESERSLQRCIETNGHSCPQSGVTIHLIQEYVDSNTNVYPSVCSFNALVIVN